MEKEFHLNFADHSNLRKTCGQIVYFISAKGAFIIQCAQERMTGHWKS